MLDGFSEAVLLDFEFEIADGERPRPICAVAKELRSGRVFHIFEGEFGDAPPWATGDDVCVVAYYGSAEFNCYRACGWELPRRVLDLYVEFRALTNGAPTPAGSGQVGALAFFGLDHAALNKHEMQKAIGVGEWRGRYTREEILDYCQRDVEALEALLGAMGERIDLPRALLRGRYMVAVSAMEHAGVPIDVPTLQALRRQWTGIQDHLVAAIDRPYGVYEGRTFKADRFAGWLVREGIPWPRLESGSLDLSDDCFRQQAKAHPQVSPLRELRASLSELRLNSLTVGADGRNRCMLSPFRARTSRNQPSNSRFIFGPSTWVRGLIRPEPGHAIAYLDYRQQEFGIGAALSGDAAMQEAYGSRDPYLTFAVQAGIAPEGATKATHAAVRELCKTCILGTQYGMQERSLAQRIGQPTIVARDLLRMHRETYRKFWAWSDAALDTAMLTGRLHTVFGWPIHVTATSNPRSLRNYLMQGNGAEILRLACCLATERGIEVTAPVHDAILIYAPLDRLEADIATAKAAMLEASRVVLDGFELGVDAAVTRYPDRYMDSRGAEMWTRVMGLVQQAERMIA